MSKPRLELWSIEIGRIKGVLVDEFSGNNLKRITTGNIVDMETNGIRKLTRVKSNNGKWYDLGKELKELEIGDFVIYIGENEEIPFGEYRIESICKNNCVIKNLFLDESFIVKVEEICVI